MKNKTRQTLTQEVLDWFSEEALKALWRKNGDAVFAAIPEVRK